MTDKSLPSAALQNRTIAGLDDIMVLLKPRVMSLAVFTSAVAMVIAPGPLHPVIALASILYIAIGAGAAGALNMWWDCDIDYRMRRTRSRPVPGKRLDRQDAFQIGMWLSGFSVVMLALTANLLAGLLLALTIFYYVVVYTIFLKRRTSQNIVIGGAAGALPPVIGWAVSAGSMPLEAWLLFLIIFLWTPPHFWALALYSADDYRRAGVPVLNITHGDRATRRQILLYSLSLAPVSAVIAVSSVGGPVFAVAAIVMNGELLRRAWLLWRREQEGAKTDRFLVERKFFRFSLFYLFVLFLSLAADKVLLMATGTHFLTSGSV